MDRIGGYLVERKLGEGGMGTVYLAHSRGGRALAVKVARPDFAADPVFRARFRAEVDAARRVGGFHTAPVVDADTDAVRPWLATAYVPGPTLAGLVEEQGPLAEPELRLLGAALAEALQTVHACGLVHRDLKPGNIIMAEDGPRVVDFGIARAAESARAGAEGPAFGTPGFLAPEQATGRDVSVAADVFALGAVLVTAAGGSAFGDGTPVELIRRSVHEEADVSHVPDEMRALVAACLAKDPAERPSTGQVLDWLVPEPTHEMALPEPAPAAAGTSAGRAPSVHGPAASSAGAREAADGAAGPGSRQAVSRRAAASPLTVPVPPPRSPRAEEARALFVRRPARVLASAAARAAGRAAGGGARADVALVDERGAVVADDRGLLFAEDGVEAEFPWDEIGRIACTANRRGTLLTVDLTLNDGHSYHCSVAVRPRESGRLLGRFEEVLGRFFTRAVANGVD